MVVSDRNEVKARFSKRLNELLDEEGAPQRGRRQWLCRKFNSAFSHEAARKWLEAEAMPDMAHLSMLCTYFGWAVDYLFTGAGPRRAGRGDPILAEINNGWRELDEDAQRHVLRNFRNERDMRVPHVPPTPAPTTPTQAQRPSKRRT